jgi:hypothetical protein
MTREIDALVAEAMGWKRVSPDDCYFWPTPEMVAKLKEEIPGILAVDYFPAPEFTTNWAAAGMVVEFLANQDVPYLLRLQEHWTDEWEAAFVHPINEPSFNSEQYGAIAPTAPLAICLAFLKAAGVEVGE